MKKYLEEVRAEAIKEIKILRKDIDDHVEKYGENPCDYLINRRELLSYYRGRAGLALELIETIK